MVAGAVAVVVVVATVVEITPIKRRGDVEAE